MTYTKQSGPQSMEVKDASNKIIASAFHDQRASTNVQLKQQTMMQAVQPKNILQRLNANENEPLQGEFYAGSVRQYVKDDPVVSVALDTDTESVKNDVNSAMTKLRHTILNNNELLDQLDKDGRDRKIYAPVLSLWKKMDGLLSAWDTSWSVEDTCGLMLDIGLQLGKGVKSAPQFKMTDEMEESRRSEDVKGSTWEQQFLPQGTRTQSGVSATTIRLLKTLSIDNSITALEIEAVMNGVCMYWDHSLIKKLTGEYHTTAEVWATYNNYLLKING